MIHTIFFDLDNTLYSTKSGVWEAVGSRINLFMTDILRIPIYDVMPLRLRLRREFGTTLTGLQSMFEVDEREYLDFVHDVDLSAMLTDDGRLREMLSHLSQRKIIFTSSDTQHAQRVLELFNVQDLFDLIVDVIATKPHVKPQSEAYQIALKLAGLNHPGGCLFVDDMLENVQQAHREGFTSCYVGDERAEFPCLRDIFDLPALLDIQDKHNNL